MTMNDRLSDEELAKVRKRRLDMQKLQEIEGNPLTADEIANGLTDWNDYAIHKLGNKEAA